jgi:hypothetical protein
MGRADKRSEFISKEGFVVKRKNDKLGRDRHRATIFLDQAL